MTVTFLLFACLPALAEEVLKTVTLETAGTLSTAVGDEKNIITNLTVSGPINSTDVATMKSMATSGALSDLDMSEATAVTTDLIGSNAFNGCIKLTSISLPKGVTSIGKHAFRSCTGLTSVAIGNSVTSIGNDAFFGCSNLTSVTIPNSVTGIGNNVFYNCSNLISVTIGNSVTSIGNNAFFGCSNLTSVTIPNSVTSIGNHAFRSCTGLTFVTIGKSVTSIGDCAFYGCSSLTSITIPNSVTGIGSQAFMNCSSLAEVTIQGKTLPECNANAFNNISSSATLYCKTALIRKCQETEPWKNFNVVARPFSITITDAGIATSCFDDDLDFTDLDVKAYIVSGYSPSAGKVLLTRTAQIPAGTGFMVKGSAGTYGIPAVATDYVYSNMLVGVLEATTVAKTDGSYTNYVLGKDTEGVAGFYLAGNSTVPANKAYLQIPTSAVTTDDASSAKTSLRLSFDDEDGTAGFIPVKILMEETIGKTVVYNLNGQRKQSLTKGLNIVNGKKIFVK